MVVGPCVSEELARGRIDLRAGTASLLDHLQSETDHSRAFAVVLVRKMILMFALERWPPGCQACSASAQKL
ncbi:MAG TPA: hypothetical protein DCG12_00530 [Planctomycetaceae bacterium]|nr:hypothetical protein [Planctomycetaceae bacterium]